MLRFQYNDRMLSGITKWGIFSDKSGYFYYAIHTLFATPRTSASIVITAERRMPVVRSFSVASNARPVLLATRHALILKRNVATDWIKRLMSAMAVIRRSPTVRLLTSTPITPALQTENIARNSAIPVPGST